MAGIRTNAAAQMLGVSASTLRGWEQRHGFPRPRRTEGNHRNYDLAELEALRDALREVGDVSTAIEVARKRGRAPVSSTRLVEAFEAFDEAAADRAMEESLAIRSLPTSVEEILLPAVEATAAMASHDAESEFACRWATGWLHAARRLAPVATRSEGVLLLDAGPHTGPETIHTQALELDLRLAGVRVLVLPPNLPAGRFRSALRALEPSAVVLCGATSLPQRSELGKLITSIAANVFTYAFESSPGSDSSPASLGHRPSAASARLIELLGG